jgi:hypothetical protein
MIPPEGSWGVETVSARIIKVDPAGGDLVYRIINGPETVPAQTVRNPFIKVFTGPVPHNFELTYTDGIEKNPHIPPSSQNERCYLENNVTVSVAH